MNEGRSFFCVGQTSIPGQTADQTIFHSHTHLIPRRSNDVKNYRGGVRHLIPGKDFH